MTTQLNSQSGSPSDNKAQDKKDCRPKQSPCRSAGVGPSCSKANNLSDEGFFTNAAEQKRRCLEDAKQYCADGAKECVKECDKEFAANQKIMSLPSRGTEAYEKDFTLIDGVNTELRAGGIEQGANLGGDTAEWGKTFVSDGLLTYIEIVTLHETCKRECYRIAADQCETVQCYCDQFECDFENPGPDGGFDPTPPDEPKDEYDEREQENELKEIQFNTDSQYGLPIELVYTKARMSGNVVWLSELKTAQFKSIKTTTDKKARTITTTTLYTAVATVNMMIGVCAGEIDGINRIAIDKVERLGPSVLPFARIPHKVYRGTSSQKVNGVHAAENGFGRTPAYRDMAMVFLPNFNIANVTSFPKFEFDVVKRSTSAPEFVESGAIAGKDTSIVWTFIDEASRMFFETSGGLACYNTTNMQPIWTAPIANTIEISPVGHPITYDGTNVGVYEVGLEAQSGAYAARLGIAQSFMFRFIDSAGNTGNYLVSQDGDGNGYLEQIDEVIPSFPSDSVGVVSLPALDTAPHEVGMLADVSYEDYVGNTATRRSVFLFRKGITDFDTIIVRELRMVGDPADTLVEDGAWYSYELPAIIFENRFTLVFNGGFYHKQSSTFFLFASNDLNKYIVKWNPTDGVIWTVTADYIPAYSKYSMVSDDPMDVYYFVSDAGVVYALDLESGDITEHLTGWEPCGGKQYYVPRRDQIIYETSTGTIMAGTIEVVSNETQNLKEVFEDILERAGVDTSTVELDTLEDITVIGYRTATLRFAADILRILSEVYLVQGITAPLLSFVKKQDATSMSVNANEIQQIPSRRRTVTTQENRTVTVEYFSETIGGEGGSQLYTLDRGEDSRLIPVSQNKYTWTVNETDEYMRKLAELYAYVIEESAVRTTITLPPKYLAFSVGDIALSLITGRISTLRIGADNSMELELVADSAEKYGSLVDIGGVDPIGYASQTFSQPATLAAPLSVSLRPINPLYENSIGMFLGASNVLDEFETGTYVSRDVSDFAPVPTGSVSKPQAPMLWGRLVTPPVLEGSAVFITHTTAFLDIDFPDEDFVTRILDMESRYGEYPDYRTVNVTDYNFLIVGKELIQYGYAEAVPGYPKRVRFVDLLRGRHDTDNFLTHVAGEYCVVYETTSCSINDFDSDAASFGFSTITSGNGEFRRQDSVFDEASLLPVDPGSCMRYDVPTPGSNIAGNVTYPDSPHVFIFIRPRERGINGFTNEDASFGKPGEKYPRELYILRGTYDAVAFDAARTGTDTSYIMRRLRGDTIVTGDSGSTNLGTTSMPNSPYDYVGVKEIGTVFLGVTQYNNVEPDFSAKLEDITVVMINLTEFGESRTVYYFPAAIDYTGSRPTHGFRVL